MQRASSSYSPNQKDDFKMGRRFYNFLTCKRCFYLDRVKDLEFNTWMDFNETTDLLLKKEFD